MARSPEQVEPASRAQWREWLAEHHDTWTGVWVVYAKKKYRLGDAPTYDDLIEEALCFGWVDGTLRPVDEQRTSLYFCPRRKGSVWAASNKERVERLRADGRMRPAGLAAIERATQDGSWTVLDRSEALQVPDELAAAFDEHPGSRDRFDAYTPGARKQLIYFVDSAKRPQTRAERAAKVAREAQHGRSTDRSAPDR